MPLTSVKSDSDIVWHNGFTHIKQDNRSQASRRIQELKGLYKNDED